MGVGVKVKEVGEDKEYRGEEGEHVQGGTKYILSHTYR